MEVRSKFPSWYSKNDNAAIGTSRVLGQAIMGELDNLRVILIDYLSFLNSQDSHNLFARAKEAGTKPTSKNSTFNMVEKRPIRIEMSKRGAEVAAIYGRIDEFMSTLKKSTPYEIIQITDVIMGIDDVDARARQKKRRQFLKYLGSDTFKFGMYSYLTPGAASKYVVVLKIDFGASITNENVIEARREAEECAPRYYSAREQKDYIAMLRCSTGMSVKHAYALLDGILPDNVVMNKQYTKDKRELLESVTFLLLSGEQDVEDEVKMLADLQSMNYREGKLNNEGTSDEHNADVKKDQENSKV